MSDHTGSCLCAPCVFAAIKRQIETFEESVTHMPTGRVDVSLDGLVTLGWARVLCDIGIEREAERP